MAKKKKLNKTDRRKVRLQKARQWVLTYEGTHIARDYGKRFKVDPVCALNDLGEIGALQPDKLAEMKRAEQIRLENRRKEREAKQAREAEDIYPDSDDNFFFIAGHTSGGAPYGVTWDEMGMEPYEPITEPSSAKPQKKQPKQQKPHGHYCKICGEHKANEKFSGKGHAAHICKQCASMSPKERADEVTLRKIEGMAFRYLSETEINWLRKKMKDADPGIRESARMAHNIKFPHYERNMVKKGLTAHSLEFFIHGSVWDEYGDEVLVNMRVFADNSGAMRRIDYDAPDGEQETSITIDRREAAKFLKAVVQQLNAPFWSEDYGLVESDMDSDFDSEDEDFADMDDDLSIEDDAPDTSTEEREPVWSLRLALNKGGETMQTSYGDDIQDGPSDLFWSLMEWFGPEDGFGNEDFEDEDGAED